MRDQVVRNFRRIAEHQAYRTGRHASVDKALEQRGWRGWGFFRRLAQERAASRQRGGQLAHHLVDREVPRRERRHRTHRLFQHRLLRRWVTRRHDPAIHAHAFSREPVDDVGASHGFSAGLGQRLALFLGQQTGDFVSTVAQQGGGAAQRGGALKRRHLAPGVKTFLRCCQCAVEVGDAGVRHGADFLAGGWVQDRNGLAASGVAPFVGDQEADVRVCDCSHAKSPVMSVKSARAGARTPSTLPEKRYPCTFAANLPLGNDIFHAMKTLTFKAFAAVFLLAGAGAHAEPPAGQNALAGPQVRVDVGGRKLNLYCTGKGAPTVLFDADTGRAGWDWSAVLPAVAARTRACVYDRGGLGSSDPIIRASTVANASKDLNFLIKNAHLDGPFVLVGTGYGALIAQQFAWRSRGAVTGLVLVAPLKEDALPADRAA